MVYVGIVLIAFASLPGAHSEHPPAPEAFSEVSQGVLSQELVTVGLDRPLVLPEENPRPVTVAELTKIVVGNGRSQSAGGLEHLQLTQRLSTRALAKLSSEVSAKAAKSALMMLADASAFLEPPSDESPQRSFPGTEEQNLILIRAADYLRAILPKLPDFFATRSTTSFRDVSTSAKPTGIEPTVGMQLVGTSRATVYYRSGKEVVREQRGRNHELVTEGIFGPILAVVLADAARSETMEWRRWENGPDGPMAVFRFQVPLSESHYHVPGFGDLGMIGPTAYHGEIGIDPSTGTILRLVLKADPGLGSSITRADVMVEYGSVTIGGRLYTCPLKSVSYFVGALPIPMAFGARPSRPTEQLNDVTFGDYHVFRAQMRILP